MRISFPFLILSLTGCVGVSEPSEAEMKEAMFAMNHPPGIANAAPITMKFFKKEASTAHSMCRSPRPTSAQVCITTSVQANFIRTKTPASG